MVFNSYTFLIFFVVVLAIHHLPISWRLKKLNLLLASYLFYAAWNIAFVPLLWISTLVDWFVGRRLTDAEGPRTRRSLLVLSLCVNLGLLGFFKYGGFLLDGAILGLALLGVSYAPAAPSIVLPVGISFYTFQTLSYTLDIYFRKIRRWDSFLDYALYVTFFPQLVAGPIVRASHFLPQCAERVRSFDPHQVGWGLALLTIGVSEKVLLADRLFAPIVETVFSPRFAPDFLSAWAGVLAFSGQIFFDFSGYSLAAIGAALCFGFNLPDNFRVPYAAVGFSDFWRRWHISLSSWLRDYLYIPLGGNRRGESRRWANVMITMLIGGLWHGAAWTFFVWGGLHGVYLLAERAADRLLGHMELWRTRYGRWFLWLLTFSGVTFAWTFFRAGSFEQAWMIVRAMVGLGAPGEFEMDATDKYGAFVLMGLVLIAQWRYRDSSYEELAGRLPAWLISCVLAALLMALVLTKGEDRAFIYFQF